MLQSLLLAPLLMPLCKTTSTQTPLLMLPKLLPMLQPSLPTLLLMLQNLVLVLMLMRHCNRKLMATMRT